MEESIEVQKLYLMKRRADEEFRIKREELELKREELQARLEEQKQKRRQISFPIIIAVIGILGTGVVTFLQGDQNRVLEKEKFHYQMILRGLEIEDQDGRANYLSFLTEVGLIEPGPLANNIDSLVKDPAKIPLLPSNVRRASGFNFRVPESPRTIREIIISDTQSPDLETELRGLQLFGVSYHYLIDHNGEIHQLVDDANIAFHTSRRNEGSIGIGLVHMTGGEDYPYPQFESLVSLLITLVNDHPIERNDILLKSDVNPRRSTDLDNRILEIRSRVQRR